LEVFFGDDDVAESFIEDEDVFGVEIGDVGLNIGDDVDDEGDSVIRLYILPTLHGDEAVVAASGDFEEGVDGHVHDAGEGLVHELEELPADGHEEAEVLVHELGELADQVPRLSSVHDVGGDGGLGLLALLLLDEV